MDSNLHVLAHAARLAAEETRSKVSPFKFTDKEREAIRAFGRALGVPASELDTPIDDAERNEEAHKAVVEALGEMDEVLAIAS